MFIGLNYFMTLSICAVMFGVILALATILILPHVPSLIGNLLWGTALISQIAYPVTRAYFTLSKEEANS